MSQTIEGRWREIFEPRYITVTLILCLGVALFAFNAFLSNTALPTAVEELNGVAVISWATTLYLVLAITGGAGAALLKLRLGSRWSLLGSAAIFLVGTMLAATATDMTMVLVGRAVQGLGEGIMAAICFALIPEMFPSRLVPKVFGMQAMVWAVAAFGGPAGAGVLTEFVSWRAAFLVNIPFVLIFVVMVFLRVPRGPTTSQVGTTFPGIRLLFIGGGIMLVAFAAIASPLAAIAFLLAAILLLWGAVRLDRGSAQRLMPPGAFWPSNVIGSGLVVALLMPIAGSTSGVYLVLLIQQLWGYGPTLAGVMGALMAVAWSLSAIAVANVRQRATRYVLIRIGPVFVTLGLLGVLGALLWTSLPLLVIAQFAIGSGFGLSNGYLNLAMMETASDEERDRTSALIPTTQSAGNAIGAALAGLAANTAGYATATTPAAVLSAIPPIFILGAMVAAIAWFASWRMVSLITRPALATT